MALKQSVRKKITETKKIGEENDVKNWKRHKNRYYGSKQQFFLWWNTSDTKKKKQQSSLQRRFRL